MNALSVVQMTAWGVSGLAILQSLEFLYLWIYKKEAKVWDWNLVSLEISKSSTIRTFLSFFLSNQNFIFLNLIRISCAVVGFFYPVTEVYVILLCLHLLTMLRWFGCFNGGSDYMNTLLLWTVSVGLYSERAAHIILWILAIHLSWSYFRSGLVKVKSSAWLKGEALPYFAQSHMYEKARFFKGKQLIMSYLVIAFELLFPLALLSPNMAFAFCAMGVLFHLANTFLFGLNRFLWTWIVAYPALFYCVGVI